ncbi:MAG: dihydrofolate reductase, partial [Proteobacteria bacterium]|nr:dihydrofolate reductase [Pseudomonadota bacterium]
LDMQDGFDVVPSLSQAIETADEWNKKNSTDDEIILIGGGYVFRESKNIVNKLVLTRVDCEIDGDVFYPQIDFNSWKVISTESHGRDHENEYDFRVETLVRI